MLSVHTVSRSPASIYTESYLHLHPLLLPPYVPNASSAQAAFQYLTLSVLLLFAVAVLVKPQSEDDFQFWPPTLTVNLPAAPKTQQICTLVALPLATAPKASLWSLSISLRLASRSSTAASSGRASRSWSTLWKQSGLSYIALSWGRVDHKAFYRKGWTAWRVSKAQE